MVCGGAAAFSDSDFLTRRHGEAALHLIWFHLGRAGAHVGRQHKFALLLTAPIQGRPDQLLEETQRLVRALTAQV